MPKVFISYRRAESQSEAGRLFDFLEREFGFRNVFKDVDSIPAGADFRKVINSYVTISNVFLIVIGEQWMEVEDEHGRRRIEQPDDFVRMELSAALSKGLRVIPVLIRNARMPSSDVLPEDIAQLAYHNAVRLRPDPDFRKDCNRLVAEIRGSQTRFSVAKIGVGAAVALGLAAAIYLGQQILREPPPKPESSVDAISSDMRKDKPNSDAHPIRSKVGSPGVNPEVVSVGRTMLSNLDKTQNTGSGFDYWPNGGIRIAYYHLATYAGYSTLSTLSPYPIYTSGPHGVTELNLDARFSFGHYNPDFLIWFHDQLLEIAEDKAFIGSTAPMFQRYLGKTLKTYWETYTTLDRFPSERDVLLDDYRTRIDNRTLPQGYYYNIAWSEASDQFASLKALAPPYNKNVVAPAIYFWLRRHIDGTHKQVFAMLETLLLAYGMIEQQGLYFEPSELPKAG